MKHVFLLLVIAIAGVSCSTSKSASDKEADKLLLKEQIESGNYKIDATMAYPRRGRSVSLTSSYSLEVKNDSVFSYLPFYGRAYTIPYGGGDGLRFEAPITDYEVSYDKKGTAKVLFSAKTNEDLFKFTLDIYPGGSSNINVVMQQREPISFRGNLEQ